MKIDLIKKAKWYIIGFILVAIMLSVSLSFCVWDNMSLKAKLANSGSGWFNDKEQLYTLEVDSNSNYIVDVGDVVSFGKYYQNITEDGNIGEKTPIRWIVVEKENNQLTLLAEKVMAFGNFWGNWYNDGTDKIYDSTWGKGWKWQDGTSSYYYQNYSASTLRAWLNSDYILRSDKGAAFSAGNSQARFRGFLSEAFSPKEQTYILPKDISGMKGHSQDSNASRENVYAKIKDKVWVPSWSEIYGTTLAQYEGWVTPIDGNWNTYDGAPNTQFSYFKECKYFQENEALIGKTTEFSSSKFSNYTVEGAISSPNMQSSQSGGNVWWWLRSPSPSSYGAALLVYRAGNGYHALTNRSDGGVRPAIIIPA